MSWSWEEDDIPVEEWPEYCRANQDCLCDECFKPLGKHYQPAKKSCPSLVVDCVGNWWKL